MALVLATLLLSSWVGLASAGAGESCYTLGDDDGDGTSNDDGALGCEPYFRDTDRDGYGVGAPRCLCRREGAWSARMDADCDDTVAWIHPDARDACEPGIDLDCDGLPTCATPLVATAVLEGFAEDLYALAAVGDQDGDGTVDFATGCITCPVSGSATGTVLVYSGAERGPFTEADSLAVVEGPSPGALAGLSVDGGDVTGDGWGDLWTVMDDSSGSVALLPGPLPRVGTLSDASLVVEGLAGDRYVGDRLGLGGDVDADGVPDAIVVGVSSTGVEEAALFPSDEVGTFDASVAPVRFTATAATDHLNRAAPAGDLDGDGVDDLALGACYAGAFGQAYVFLGPVSGTAAVLDADLLVEAAADGRTGWTLARAGDLDSDGVTDLAIGAPFVGDMAGEVDILFGGAGRRAGDTSVDVRLSGVSRYDLVGWVLAGDLDLDGDGAPEIVTGGQTESWIFTGPWTPGAWTIADAAVVLMGSDNKAGWTSLGDTDGDRRDDVAFIRPLWGYTPGDVKAGVILGGDLPL